MKVQLGKFDGVKVFAATMYQERAALSDRITNWLTANAPTLEVVDIVMRQSSDAAYHCVTCVIFYRRRSTKK